MLSKEEKDGLDRVWAEAIAHAGMPPPVLNDEYIRDAIYQTSMATSAYQIPSVTTFSTKLLSGRACAAQCAWHHTPNST